MSIYTYDQEKDTIDGVPREEWKKQNNEGEILIEESTENEDITEAGRSANEAGFEVFEDEDLLCFSDDHTKTYIDIDSAKKEFHVNMHYIDDAYSHEQKYKYKINSDPVEVLIRLYERTSMPPFHYLVRDGVVLKSEILKDSSEFMRNNLIDELVKEVEWHAMNYGALFFYILSKHPEILATDDFRKFLRQMEEKFKQGLEKCKDFLSEKDNTGLQIIDGRYGRIIWYENIDSLSDEERERRNKNVEKNIYQILFNKKSKNYCGLTKEEFETSGRLLNEIDYFLNKKQHKVTHRVTTEKNKSNCLSWFIIIIFLFILLTVIF